ncbi:MAG: polysaccharide biosynthesis/export family protein [Dysgonomonas sp.]
MNKLVPLLLLLIILASCNASKDVLYMQDIPINKTDTIFETEGMRVRSKDKLAIVVSCKNPELSAMFNLPVVSSQGNSDMLSAGQQQKMLGYFVDNEGNIDFPILGTLHVSGLTRKEISDLIKHRIKDENLIQDLIVTVDFANLKFSVLGEVKAPGMYDIEGDRITILEAIGMAQDLTIYGKREKVLVIREENGKRINYQIDLRSSQFFTSPAYYLQQNDVVYVQPNNVRAGQSTINDNNFKSVTLWTSIASLFTTIAILIWK